MNIFEIYFLRSNAQIIQYLNKESSKNLLDVRKFMQIISNNFQKNEVLL